MLGLRTSFAAALSRASPIASSSRVVLPPLPQFALGQPSAPAMMGQQVRFKSNLTPKRVRYRKMQKGSAHMPTGGSLKGTSLEIGQYGIRVLQDTRITASQLTSALAAMRRKIKNVKGAEVFTRVFPDRPVCVKGNETRMGKGKGAFSFWAVWVPVGRVIFEIGGGGIREEIAKQALKLAQVKLPVVSEFIDKTSPPRLGSISSHDLVKPPAALPAPAQLAELDAKGEGSAVKNVLEREERTMESIERTLEALAVEGAAAQTEARA